LNLVDIIEHHIKRALEASQDNKILLRRNELAQSFGCAPSQINYVIQTRFNVERGYITESQRGGGGYIRVIRLDTDKFKQLLPSLAGFQRGGVSQRQALDLVHWLQERKLISSREAQIMASVLDRTVLDVELPLRDRLRSRLLLAMLEAIIREG